MNLEVLKRTGNRKACTCAIIIKDSKVLIGLRHYTPDKWKNISVWTTPGGRCDDGEILEINLRREVMEETGISDLKILSFLGEFPGATEGDHLLLFRCETNQEVKLTVPEKFSEWRWVGVNEIPANFINPDTVPIIIGELNRSPLMFS